MNGNPTQAQHLFDKFVNANGVDHLKSLPNLPEKTFESDWLDFKSGQTKPEDLKRIWSKAMACEIPRSRWLPTSSMVQ